MRSLAPIVIAAVALSGCATVETPAPIVEVVEQKVEIQSYLPKWKPEPKAVGMLAGQKVTAGFIADFLAAVGRHVEATK